MVSLQLKLMIEIELAYMNTNHPDFIGFDKASKRDKRGGTRAAGNQLIRKGWLSMPVSLIKGSSRDYWFVLSSDSLTWYKDDEVSGPPPLLLLWQGSIWWPALAVLMMQGHHSCLSLFHSMLWSPFLFQEKELKYSLRLEDMRVRDVEAGRFSIGKKHVFALFYTTGKCVQ